MLLIQAPTGAGVDNVGAPGSYWCCCARFSVGVAGGEAKAAMGRAS